MRRTLLLMVILAGCSTAHGRAVGRAQEAARSGDLQGEAFAWAEACRLRPDDAASCSEAHRAAHALLARAETFCEATSPRACLEALEPVGALGTFPRVEARAREAQEAICGREPQELGAALAWIACMDHLPLSEEASRAARLGSSGRIRARMGQVGQGASALLQEVAGCLEGGHPLRPRSEAQRKSVRLSATIDGSSVLGLCEDLAHLPIACGAGERFSIAAHTLGVDHHVSHRTLEGTYEAGTRRHPNPDWTVKSQRVLDLEAEVRAAEGRSRRADEACRQAERHLSDARHCRDCPARYERERRCADKEELGRIHRDREGELSRAKLDLVGVPDFYEEAVVRPYRIREALHRWEVDVEVSLGRGEVSRQSIVLEDREHPGFAPAGIAADPLHVPGAGDITDAIRSRLRGTLEQQVRAWLIRQADARAASCPLPARWSDDVWLECWAESSFWRGQGHGGAELVGHAGVECG